MQIIGTLKCKDTKKCRLWFDERSIPYHFVDLTKRGLSPGELKALVSGREWDDLMDKNGKIWAKRQLAWKEYDAEEELLANPLLMKTPILREGKTIVMGYQPTLMDELFSKGAQG